MKGKLVVSDTDQDQYRHLKHLASVPFHVYLWSVVTLTLCGNCVVVIWRCTRPASQRSSALSIIIVNLAVVDFLYGVHLLLIESTLVSPVFEDVSQHHLDSKPDVDQVLCYTAYFLSSLSCAAQSVALASIAAYWMLSLRCLLQPAAEKVFVALSILTQWALALILTSISAFSTSWPVPWNTSNITDESPVNVEVYYVFTQCSFSGTLDPSVAPLVTLVLALISLTTVLYVSYLIRLCCNVVSGRHQTYSQTAKFLTIRLCVILTVNILCLGPPIVLYYFGKKAILNVLMLLKDNYCLSITEVNVILLSIPPALNPLLYTIVTKKFLTVLKNFFFLSCSNRFMSESRSETSETTSLFPEETPDRTRYLEDADMFLYSQEPCEQKKEHAASNGEKS